MTAFPRKKLVFNDRAQVNALCVILGSRLESLLDALGVRLQKRGKMLAGPCPVHGGRRPDAFNLYPEGEVVRGNWKCRSSGGACNRVFRGTVLGLVWGVLSRQRLGWSGEGDQKILFKEAVKWACEFIGQPLGQIRVDPSAVDKAAFASQAGVLYWSGSPQASGWSRQAVRARMECPAAYYLGRGYTPGVLDRYDVGLWLPCGKPSPMTGRLAVPIYDDDHRRVLGITGRSPFEKCPVCRQHHDPSLPGCPERSPAYAKWFNQGFPRETLLYNFWFARPVIKSTGAVVLVEGPGDVWRLEEAGVLNSLAMFGCELTDRQQIVLEQSGASDVIFFPHNDETGKQSVETLRRELGRTFRVHVCELPSKDVGEMTVQEIKDFVQREWPKSVRRA